MKKSFIRPKCLPVAMCSEEPLFATSFEIHDDEFSDQGVKEEMDDDEDDEIEQKPIFEPFHFSVWDKSW